MVNPLRGKADWSEMGEESNIRRRRYVNPPVVEAIARLQWTTPIAWSFTTPGLLFERLREEYPEEPREQGVVQAGVNPGSATDLGSASLEVRTGPRRILFGRDDGTRLIGLSAFDISVHGLHPYEGWESLRTRLTQALDAASDLLGGDDRRISQVGLRYINRVEIPKSTIEFGDYLTISLGFPEGFPPKITGFLDRTEMQYDESLAQMAFTWASTDSTDDGLAFILDLDLNTATDGELDVHGALSVLEDLKAKEGMAFEALLQDKLRSQFGEVE